MKLTTLIIILALSLLGGFAAASPCARALAAPRAGTIEFGTHMDKPRVEVYPVRDVFPAGPAPFYAASFRHPVHSMHVTVALSLIVSDRSGRHSSTELKALEREYVDYATDRMMGWLPKETLRPATYVLTIRGHGTVLAEGSFRVVRSTAEDIGPCTGCWRIRPRP